MKNYLRLFFAIILLSLLVDTTVHANNLTYNPILVKFVDKMVDEHGFQRQAVKSVLAQAKIKPVIIEKMTRPAEAFPWHRYRNIFLKPKRISQGIAFWLQYAALLKEAEKTYGVPAEIIVAILGVETRFGRIKGGFRLVDSLTTIAVDYPKRRQYFLKELEQAFLLAREENFDLLSLVGSYAGAMGMAQFMPSSYRHYAVDGDNDGVRDLLHNPADAVGSIANYLKLHHWKPGEPIATRATVVGTKYRQFIKKGMKPSVRIHDIGRYQVTAEKNYSKKLKASLIALEQQHGFEYWLGLNNFYSITRYNHSNLYAMAVYQLAEEIRAGYQLVRKI